MVNCAHPSHFAAQLEAGGESGGSPASAPTPRAAATPSSTKPRTSTAATPAELGREYGSLVPALPDLRVLGGCCGTDHRHIARICAELFPTDAPG